MPAKVVSYKPDAADYDPLTIRPPPYETADERRARLMNEQEAKAVSDRIDADLEKSVTSEKRGPKPVKILLLGTSPFTTYSFSCSNVRKH